MSKVGIALVALYALGYFVALVPVTRAFAKEGMQAPGVASLIFSLAWPFMIALVFVGWLGHRVEAVAKPFPVASEVDTTVRRLRSGREIPDTGREEVRG